MTPIANSKTSRLNVIGSTIMVGIEPFIYVCCMKIMCKHPNLATLYMCYRGFHFPE